MRIGLQKALGPATCLALNLAVVEDSRASEASYSPYADREFPENLYWGDLHLHTNLSIDAYGMGNTALSPEEAYRFAKGEAVTAHGGMRVRLHRPLDFLVIADHAENLAVMPRLAEGDERLLSSDAGREWYEAIKANPLNTQDALNADSLSSYLDYVQQAFSGRRSFYYEGFAPGENSVVVGDQSFQRSVWAEVGRNAERHNDPGRFTAFIGYEWTSPGPGDFSWPESGAGTGGIGNVHRVVIYRDGPELTGQMLPFSTIDSADPEELWEYLSRYEALTGGRVLAIPHNGNTSNGQMFALQDFAGERLSPEYAEARSRWEPLYEVTQIKGDSETHPILSPNDEFADFETWNSWAGPTYDEVISDGWERRKASEYARSALKLGLGVWSELGVNPFKLGLIGSSDAHTGLAAVAEDNFWGKSSLFEPSKYRIKAEASAIAIHAAAGGYAAVWATENTREALFSALVRRETYASTGPRIALRFFGGWRFRPGDSDRPDLAATGYAKGVPMGEDLPGRSIGDAAAPSFLIAAHKDPDGANLDRIQVVKGWREISGQLRERVYNVALSGGRVADDRGRVPVVGSTVDVQDATYANSIGAAELITVWSDPDFDRAEPAFYYVRVLQIPTPRWPAYDARYFGQEDLPADLPMVLQERAYSSPIWYTP